MSREEMTHGPCQSQQSHQESTIVGCPFPAVCRRPIRTSDHVLSCSVFKLHPPSYSATSTPLSASDYASSTILTRSALRHRRCTVFTAIAVTSIIDVPLEHFALESSRRVPCVCNDHCARPQHASYFSNVFDASKLCPTHTQQIRPRWLPHRSPRSPSLTRTLSTSPC